MTTKAALPPEAEAYLSALRTALADLSPDEREGLLEEVADSLREVLNEGDSIVARLGTPEDFAAELRLAAGLPPTHSTPHRVSWATALERTRALSSAFAPDLAPIWWLVRAYVAVAALALVFGSTWSNYNGAVPRLGTAKAGLAVLLLAAALSVALGMLGRRRASLRKGVLTLNAVLVLALVPVAVHLALHPRGTAATLYAPPVAAPTPALTLDGMLVTNIYPFARDGRLLHDVLLYASIGPVGNVGLPMSVRPDDPDRNRRLLRTIGGRTLFNSFPIRYFDPGTRTVGYPDAAPGISVPKVAPGSARIAPADAPQMTTPP
jgi:uncharacterized membrane protein